MEQLIPTKTALQQVEGVEFVRDYDVRVRIEKRSDQAMAGPGITDEHAVGFDPVEQLDLTPLAQPGGGV